MKVRLAAKSGPVTAIAVGGNTLSRGLTLEGLVSSLFVRAVSAYDTLLQMGRWFGYRNHYADLPRIWMTDELSEWFSHLATVEAEIYNQAVRLFDLRAAAVLSLVQLACVVAAVWVATRLERRLVVTGGSRAERDAQRQKKHNCLQN